MTLLGLSSMKPFRVTRESLLFTHFNIYQNSQVPWAVYLWMPLM